MIAVLIITALILVLAFNAPDKQENKAGSAPDAAKEFLASSDAVAGENNSEIAKELTPAEVCGYYIDDSDGWYYSFELAPTDKYDGTFSAGFDANHASAIENPQKNFSATGTWKLSHGEIKLYSNDTYQSSMWACGDYIVDSQNYFVGDIDPEKNKQQTVLVSKPGNSGDTQIFNLYNDGKMIMEIKRNDGKDDLVTDSAADSALDSAADSALQPEPLPSYELFAGTYEKKGDKMAITVGGATQEYYVVNDGLAKWIYLKK